MSAGRASEMAGSERDVRAVLAMNLTEADLPGLAATCTLLVQAGEPSPLARMVPIVAQLAEGCIGNPWPWRHAEQSWRRLRQLAAEAAGEVDAARAVLRERWSDERLGGIAEDAGRFSGHLTGLGELADAMTGAAADLHAGFLDAQVRFVSVTAAAAAGAHLADLYPDPAEQVVRKTAIIGAWLAEAMSIVAAAIVDAGRLDAAGSPVAGAFRRLTQYPHEI